MNFCFLNVALYNVYYVEAILSNKLDDFVENNIGNFFSNKNRRRLWHPFLDFSDSASSASEASAMILNRFVFMSVSIAARLALPQVILRREFRGLSLNTQSIRLRLLLLLQLTLLK